MRSDSFEKIVSIIAIAFMVILLTAVVSIAIQRPPSTTPCSTYSEWRVEDIPARCATYFGVKDDDSRTASESSSIRE